MQKMFDFLRPPSTKYKSVLDKNRFELIWKISFLLIPIFTILMIIHIIFNDKSVVTSVLAIAVASFNLIVLYLTRKYFLVSSIFIAVGLGLCLLSLLVINDSALISDTLWVVMVTIFSFFMFNYRVGFLVTFIGFSAIVWDLNSSSTYIFRNDVQTMINLIYVTIVFLMVLYNITKTIYNIQLEFINENNQKEVLLKEIHHRVKNNLQIISSLLKLQAEETGNPVIIEEFSKAIHRVQSMALIHDKMYNSLNISEVDLKEYISDIVKHIVFSYNDRVLIRTNLNSEVFNVQLKNMVPLSLILNECITNSVKHAFHDEKKEVYLNIDFEGEKIILEYYDSGNADFEKINKGFGLQLIEILVEQLDGSFERLASPKNGYRFIFQKQVFLN